MLKKFIDTLCKFPTRFRVDGEQKEVIQDWGITQFGTADKAEYFNEMQKNGLYFAKAIRKVENSTEIYDIDINGIEEFGNFNSNLIISANETNTTKTCKLRLNNVIYDFKLGKNSIEVNEFGVDEIFITTLDFEKKIAYISKIPQKIINEISEKMDKGTYNGTGQDLKELVDKKEPKITKNTAFNKNFGTNSLEVLEGAKLAEILGVNYGGILNNSSTKTAGKAYYDTATKAVYLCKITNNLNYADLSKFEDFSNKGLLNKLENLKYTYKIFRQAFYSKSSLIVDPNWIGGTLVLQFNGRGYQHTFSIVKNYENFYVMFDGSTVYSVKIIHTDTGIRTSDNNISVIYAKLVYPI